MRISGGEWCGRTLLMPKSDLVRPTQDRVREALFNLMMGLIPGCRFLDLFAGSGAVGLDALSRGAGEVTFLERDRKVFETLRKNMDTFGVPADCAHCTDALLWLGLSETGTAKGRPVRLPARVAQPYDIVFADPPYLWAKENGFAAIAEALRLRGLIAPGGLLTTETDYRTDPADLPGYELLRDRLYGKTRIVIYRAAAQSTDK